MGRHLIRKAALDTNDTTASLIVDVSDWDRITVQMHDPGGKMSTGVVTLQVGVCQEVWNAYPSGAVTFTSTTTTHFQTNIDVEICSHIRLIPTTANGAAGDVLFTVYGYNVED